MRVIITHESNSNIPRYFTSCFTVDHFAPIKSRSGTQTLSMQYLSQTASIVALLPLHCNVPDISSRIITTFLKILEWRTAEYCNSFFGPLKIRRKRRKASALIYSILINWCWRLTKLLRDLNFIGEIFDSCLLLSLFIPPPLPSSPYFTKACQQRVNMEHQEAMFSFSFGMVTLASIRGELFWHSFIFFHLKFP